MSKAQLKNRSHFEPIAKLLQLEIRQPLDQLRSLIRNYVAFQSAIWGGLYAIAVFWLGGLVDYAPVWLGSSESPMVARALILIAGIVGLAAILVKYGLLRGVVPWSYSSLALLLERHYPQLQSRLVTTVQAYELQGLESTIDSDPVARELHDRTRQNAVADLTRLDVTRVLSWKRFHLQLALLVLFMIFSIAFTAWQPGWTSHWSKRLFALSNEPWPRQTRIRIDRIELEVPSFTGQKNRESIAFDVREQVLPVTFGRSATLHVSADMTAAMVPDTCIVSYRLEKGGTGRSSMKRLNRGKSQWQPFFLDGPPLQTIDQGIDLMVSGGDVRLPALHLRPVDNPLLSDVQLEISYPEYLQRTMRGMSKTEMVPYQNGMRLPQGTAVTFACKANTEISRIDYVLTDAATLAKENLVIQSMNVSGREFRIPLGALSENLLIEIRLWDQHHLSSDRILQYVLTIVPDSVPRIDLVLRGIGPAVTPIATIPVIARLQDDHGVRNSWIELGLNTEPPVRELTQVNSDGQSETVLDLQSMTQANRIQPAAASTLTLTVAADDYFDLNTAPRIGRSSSIQLQVVTPDQLLIMLERRELAMRNRIELVLSELQQMRELLQRIESSNETSLDRPGVQSALSPQVIPPSDRPAIVTDQEPIPDAMPESEKAHRLQLIRVQQANVQVRKSEGELVGVSQEIGQICDELSNNRIDSQDRQSRLESKVRQPIRAILDQHFVALTRQIGVLEADLASPRVPDERIRGPIRTTDQIIVELQSVLQNMIDIQDFNELVDMVRSIIDDQRNLLDKTKSEQTKQVLELFKERN